MRARGTLRAAAPARWLVAAAVCWAGCSEDPAPAAKDSGAADAAADSSADVLHEDATGNSDAGASTDLGAVDSSADSSGPNLDATPVDAAQPDVPGANDAVDAGDPCAGKDCDDQQSCTQDSCNDGQCAHLPVAAPCTDDNACTTGDACADGKCTGVGGDCDDGNACTDDTCKPAIGCKHAPGSDGKLCAGGKCASGKCALLGPCDGKKPGDPCEDGDKCTEGETCQGGACKGAAVNCDDKDPCTDNACLPAAGCTATDNNAPCDDGDACTKADGCAAGKCVGGKLDCNDGNDCTLDACESKQCTHDYASNGAKCEDGNLCTTSDDCSNGKCLQGEPKSCDDGKPCTADACDKATGKCGHTVLLGKVCEGPACLQNGKCNASGNCEGKLIPCDDGNDCTVDACGKDSGGKVSCVHTAAKAGTVCGEVKRCDGTVCVDGGNGWARGIAAADHHTCAIRGCGNANACQPPHGAMHCWGAAAKGQLGSGISASPELAPKVVGTGSWLAVAAGEAFTCAIDKDQVAWCWGANSFGQLANNSTSAGVGKPGKVLRTGGLPLEDNLEIVAGGTHACARQAEGLVHCWGGNDVGQLAAGGTWKASQLGKIALLPKSAGLAASGETTCSIGVDGKVHCVGGGGYGELGHGKKVASSIQNQVVHSLQAPLLVRGGHNHFCALTSQRQVVCWGRGHLGQNGAAGKDATAPTLVKGLPLKVFGLDAGGDTTCAFGPDGTTWCWGAGNGKQNGTTNASKALQPVKIGGAPKYLLALGMTHACGLTTTGNVTCWGSNAQGQVGIGVLGGVFSDPKDVKTSP